MSDKVTLKDFITSANQLRSDDPYNEVVEIFKKKNLYNDFVALVYTSVLGFDTVYCEYNGSKDRFEWSSDWYEGGECHLIAFCPIDEIMFCQSQVWKGYEQ